MGLPYWALQHFTDQVGSSRFEEERRQYCLPVLDPNVISCREEPFDQSRGRTNSTFVQYNNLTIEGSPIADTYEIAIPANATADNLKYRIGDQGLGTMLVRMYPEEWLYNTTFITAVDSAVPHKEGANQDGYASLLYFLMYGVMPDDSIKPKEGPFHFVARCEFESIKYRDNHRSSWRKVDFVLKNGVSRANVTNELCENPRGNGTSGFADLYFDIEGSADVMSSTDGYCKLFNKNLDESTGTNIFSGMSRLDAIVNKMLHVASTSWSQSIHQYAMMNQSVYDQPIMMTTYPHLYVIRINWTPTTYIGLALSILIALNTYLLAARWARATYSFGFDTDTWNLLEPVDLMAYSLAAYEDLAPSLNTNEGRSNVIRGKTASTLKERPIWKGTESLLGLVNTPQSPMSPTSTTSPTSTAGEKTTDQSFSVAAVARPDSAPAAEGREATPLTVSAGNDLSPQSDVAAQEARENGTPPAGGEERDSRDAN